MPVNIRTETAIQDAALNLTIAQSNGQLTDMDPKAVLSILHEAPTLEIATLYQSLWEIMRTFYFQDAEGEDLDARMADLGLTRQGAVAATATVTCSLESTVTDDVLVPAATQLYAEKADGTKIYYSSDEDVYLAARGRSVSGATPATTTTIAVNDAFQINLDGDGAQAFSIGTQGTGAAVAAAIQVAVRALVAVTPAKQPAYDAFNCDYSATVTGCYCWRSGTVGTSSSCVVSAAVAANGADDLKMGVMYGGTETVGAWTDTIAVTADTAGTGGNVAAGAIANLTSGISGVSGVSNLSRIDNGVDQWSDQEFVNYYLLWLGGLPRPIASLPIPMPAGGTVAALEYAARAYVFDDGVKHVRSAKCYEYPTGEAGDDDEVVILYIWTDAGSPTEAQLTEIQGEIDGDDTAEHPGWRPAGITVVAKAATARTVPVWVTVTAKTDVNTSTLEEQIENVIVLYFAGLDIGQSVYPSKIREAISRYSSSYIDYVLLTPTASVDFTVDESSGEKATLGTIVVSVA